MGNTFAELVSPAETMTGFKDHKKYLTDLLQTIDADAHYRAINFYSCAPGDLYQRVPQGRRVVVLSFGDLSTICETFNPRQKTEFGGLATNYQMFRMAWSSMNLFGIVLLQENGNEKYLTLSSDPHMNEILLEEFYSSVSRGPKTKYFDSKDASVKRTVSLYKELNPEMRANPPQGTELYINNCNNFISWTLHLCDREVIIKAVHAAANARELGDSQKEMRFKFVRDNVPGFYFDATSESRSRDATDGASTLLEGESKKQKMAEGEA